MKSFLTVLEYELRAFLKNKVYLISTIIIGLIIVACLTVPAFLLSGSQTSGEETSSGPYDESTYVYIDKTGSLDTAMLESALPGSSWIEAKDEAELRTTVEQGTASAGLLVEDLEHYTYYVFNSSLFDSTEATFTSLLQSLHEMQWLEAHQIDPTDYADLNAFSVQATQVVLGKDGASNYVYTYILIFALYMVVLLYGQNIAVSIASEKSNRAIEILVTSASHYALIFGKVIAGALAGIIQFAILLALAGGTYALMDGYWNGALDFIFHIPANILGSFAIFGILGYLLYAFIFGMIGAMAQKSEDINASSTPISIIYIVSFVFVYMAMGSGDEVMLSIASYVPFTSFMGMFSRMAMVDVPLIEVLLSLVILIATTVGVGILASKIYRLGTLMYGNKITFKSMLKALKDQ